MNEEDEAPILDNESHQILLQTNFRPYIDENIKIELLIETNEKFFNLIATKSEEEIIAIFKEWDQERSYFSGSINDNSDDYATSSFSDLNINTKTISIQVSILEG